MSWPRTHKLSYSQAIGPLADYIAQLPFALYLKGSGSQANSGRYSMLCAQPYMRFELQQGRLQVTHNDGKLQQHHGCPFAALKSYLPAPVASDTPLSGGLMGYWGYELGSTIEPSVPYHFDDITMPDMLLGLYDWVIVIDEQEKTAELIQQGLHPQAEQVWQRNLQTFSRDKLFSESKDFAFTGKIASNMSYAQYQRAFNQIKHHLQQGDCYQVNLAQRFCAPFSGSYWGLFCEMNRRNPAPFSAYMRLPNSAIISCSPERFLSYRDGEVQTKPIKGTLPRARDPVELQNSEKDRSENLMIVDLMRNDIGKVCKPGSVQVPKLFDIETYTSVHHMVSTVTGELGDHLSALDLLQACFPGGSITGAPKVSAMQKIAALEPHARHIYCGSLGYIDYAGNMDTSIAIRTGVATQDNFYFWAGGGIVMDSACKSEYQECFDKVIPFTELITRVVA
jgi:para-aminobenzoate synthetase component 1